MNTLTDLLQPLEEDAMLEISGGASLVYDFGRLVRAFCIYLSNGGDIHGSTAAAADFAVNTIKNSKG